MNSAAEGLFGRFVTSYNRLHSIADDADFVRNQVGAAYPDFPLVGAWISHPLANPVATNCAETSVPSANQRAGAWYVKPTGEHIHAYFKCVLCIRIRHACGRCCYESHIHARRSTDGHAGQHDFNLRRQFLLPLYVTLFPHHALTSFLSEGQAPT